VKTLVNGQQGQPSGGIPKRTREPAHVNRELKRLKIQIAQLEERKAELISAFVK
jgi:hypothetical protein